MYGRTSNVQVGWHNTPEGEAAIHKFYYAKHGGKRPNGILERPLGIPGVEEVSYKVQFVGKSGTGKTWLISKLAGLTAPNVWVETPGIRLTNIYWPVKVWDKILVFKLQCWDAGADSIRKYAHISSVCGERSDLIVFLFSFTDVNSFFELPQAISRHSSNDLSCPAFLVVGTRFNLNSKMEVNSNDVKDLENKCNIKVLVFPPIAPGYHDMTSIAPVLNNMCEVLWIRDQQYILNQGVTV